jgi:uncharacterized protein DUF3467
VSDTPEDPKKPAAARQIQIKIEDGMASGVYSNMAMIHHNDSEFVLDFLYVQPQQPRANVRARVITSPRHVKRLIKVLQDQLAHYESHHGTVEPAPPMAGPGSYH